MCIVHWPKGLDTEAKGEVRSQYIHAVDVTPTILELLDIDPPASIKGVTQSPMHGASFAGSLKDANAPAPRETQYYEMLGNRAVYHQGWKAVTYHGTEGMIYDGVTDPHKSFDEDIWELYHVEEDFSEAHDLANEYPQKLRELQDIWWIEAAKYNVLPIDARTIGRAIGRPRPGPKRHRFVYYPGGAPVEVAAAVNIKNRSHSITAEAVIPRGGAEGVLLASGGRFGGFSFYVQGGKLRYAYNYLGREMYDLASTTDVPEGPGTFAFSFEKTGAQPFGAGGVARLYVNGHQAAEAEFPRTVPFMISLAEMLQCGYDEGAPVTDAYQPPFAFTGDLKRVIVDVSGPEPPRDLEQEAAIEIARQ
jgi:arylsulfatase